VGGAIFHLKPHRNAEVTAQHALAVATDLSGPEILAGQDTRRARTQAMVAVRSDEEDTVTARYARNVIALLLLATPLIVPTSVATQDGQPAAATHQKLTFEGDTALWTVAIKPDKTADFEQIMKKLQEALVKSNDPQRKMQAAGWKVMKVSKPLADGNIAYVHIVHPVVSGADYTIMQTLYDAYPDERQALYELYRGAFAQNLSLATGTIAVEPTKIQQ
jgi:hypothetical protein